MVFLLFLCVRPRHHQPKQKLTPPPQNQNNQKSKKARTISSMATLSKKMLPLRISSLKRVLARGVTLWRVNSLEDTHVGTAILARDWKVVSE